MQSYGHNMLDWCHLLLAVHLASATFINTNLRVPFAAIAPNQLRIYKEYIVQQKYANTDQSEGFDEEEEGQKILVNCTIRSTNATSKETGKIIKRTTANCTVTHDDVELEMKAEQKFTNEQRLSTIKEEGSEMVGSSVLIHDNDLEVHTNNTEVSNVTINEQQETRKTIKIIDPNNKESGLLIPAVIGAVTSHSQAVGGIGERNLKSDVDKIEPTFEIAFLHSSNEKQIVPAVFNSIQQNDTDEAILISRSAKNEFTLTQPVNGSIHQNSNATEHKCNETTTASPLMDGLEQITSGVSGDTREMDFPNDTRRAFTNTKTSVVKSGTDKIQIFRDTTEKLPDHLNEYDPPRNSYSFDNSGRLIEKQTPINFDYKASTVSEKPLQRQPESTTKPSSDWRHVSEQSPGHLNSKTVNNSFALVKDTEDQTSKSAKKIAFKRPSKTATAKSRTKFLAKLNRSNIKDRSGLIQTIGSSQFTPDLNNRYGHFRRAENLKFSSNKVADRPFRRKGNEYPLADRLQNNVEENLSQQLRQRIVKYFSRDSETTLDQNLGKKTANFQDFGHRQKHPYGIKSRVPQSPTHVQLNQPSRTSTWNFANVPHQKTIWDTLQAATNKAHNGIYYTSI